MAQIREDKCVGCRSCQKYCSVDAIKYDSEKKKCYIEQNECVDCYVCVRQQRQFCKREAFEPAELTSFYKQFAHVMSDPCENHGVTGVTGRGTEEVKTNDVTGRVSKGHVGFCIDVGRPGAGCYLYDVEKIAMAIAAAGVKLLDASHTPLAALMTNLDTGKLKEDCLNTRMLSVIVEGSCEDKDFKNVMRALLKVKDEIDTVFSLGLILRVDENGKNPILSCLDVLEIPQPFRGKVNVGLGKPLCLD